MSQGIMNMQLTSDLQIVYNIGHSWRYTHKGNHCPLSTSLKKTRN
jgi:hypothetical protein